MRAVVIGGNGFIGAEIVRELLRRGSEVVVVDRNAESSLTAKLFQSAEVEQCRADIRDRGSLEAAFAGADEVYHLAGMLGTSELESEIRQAIDANIVGCINVFEAALSAGVPTVFYPSKPNVWLNTYTITKYASEQFARLYTEMHPVRICSLRYFNAYGPRQHLYPVRKIIPAFAAQAMRGKPIAVFGDGSQTVDMIYAPDLGRITVDFVRSDYVGVPLDCGRGIPLSVNQVAEAVNSVFGNWAGIRHVQMRQGETPNTHLVAEIEPLQRVIGRMTFADWGESLRETLEWYERLDGDEIETALQCYGVA